MIRIRKKTQTFRARIYKTGINFAVDVPARITASLEVVRGYIRIRGTVNDFPFIKSLVPVKGRPYRLFVNMITLKGAKTTVGKIATFVVEQDEARPEVYHPMPPALQKVLREKGLLDAFENLTPSRKKDILRYMNSLKREETFERNMQKLIAQLQAKKKDVRIP
jgi:hypothetical protein